MTKRPLCLLCFLMILVLSVADLMGIPLVTGNPLPVSVQEWIEAHPGSVICGEVESSENTEFSQSVYLKKTYLIYHSKKIPIENVRAFLKKEEDLQPGMKVLLKGTLKRVEKPTNPGGFDSRQYYACRHIYYFMKKAVLKKKTATGSGYRQILFTIKEKCGQILERVSGEDAPVLKAMVLGDKKELDTEIRMRYQLAGIVHILAISGLHISILGMGLYELLKKAGLGIWPAGILSLVVILNYGMITGGSVSTIRAVTMFLLAMGARITGRIYDMQSALAVAAMMILAESPAYLRDSGFLLSFGCVLAVGMAVEIRFLLQLVTLPVMLEFFGEVSLAGLFLNLLVLPSVGIVLTCGVISVLLGIFCLPAARIVILPARALLLLYRGLCAAAGKSRFSTWIGGKPEIWQILVYGGVLFTVLFMVQYRKKQQEQHPEKKFLWFCVLTAVFMICGILVLGYHPVGKLKILCLDVGQGDGILVETPENHHFLIDGGSSSQSELGRYCLLPALKSLGISKLDGIFISHTDLDHISGVKELLEDMGKGLTTIRAEYLILPDWEEQPRAWSELKTLAENAGVKVRKGKRGDIIKSDAVTFSVLWPGKNKESSVLDVNEEAMVMELSMGDFQMLFTGDIGAETEKKLLEQNCLEDIDCLKVGHHGSRYSSSEEFLKKLKPEIAVISCSDTNTYGHPSPETLERLEKAGARVEYTMKNGAITLETDGKKISVRRFLQN